MKEAGCYSLSFGVESGNQETLNYIKKNQNLGRVKEAFDICHKIGIETVAFVIIGFPNEGRREIDKTLNFFKRNQSRCCRYPYINPFAWYRVV